MNYKLNYKFKPGDKVTVRKDLATYETYRMLSGETPGLNLMATPSMEELRGKQVVIANYENCGRVSCYTVKNSFRYWTDEMFEESKRPLSCRSLL